MSRKATNPNYVTFGKTETVVMFKTDRGQLRSNDMGDFFLREMVDGRFTCASPDLERVLVSAGVRAGIPIGVTRETHGRSVIWKARLVGNTVEMPSPNWVAQRKPAAALAKRDVFPPEKYAHPEPPALAFPEVEAPTPARVMTEAPTSAVAVEQRPDGQHITTSDNLLARCLCEAVDAVQVAQRYATERGYAVAFGAPEVERIGVSIFIERTRNGAVYERRPASIQYLSGKAIVHGAAQ